MSRSIFSTYKQGENRVTSTILSVLENINTSIVTEILQTFLEDSTLELIKYENQINSSDSVPDARIKGLFDFVIETKIYINKIDSVQIEKHLNGLDYEFSKLVILTPDLDYPDILRNIDHPRAKSIIWGNFNQLILSIDSVLEDNKLILDREAFLLNQLKYFILNENLISEDYSNKVIIVPAREAWPFYQNYSIYRCQSNRFFQKASYMGFYSNGVIKTIIPKIIGYIDDINLHFDDLKKIDKNRIKTEGNNTKNQIINRLLVYKNNMIEKEQNNQLNGNFKYIILSDIDDSKTKKLSSEIINDKVSKTNKNTAFVQKQGYYDFSLLKAASFTSDLT